MKKWNEFWGVCCCCNAWISSLLSLLLPIHIVRRRRRLRRHHNIEATVLWQQKKRALLYARNLLLVLLYLLLTRNFHVSRLLHRLQIIWTRKTTCFWFQQCDSKLNALTSNIVQHRETTQKKNIKAPKTEKDTFLIYVWILNVSHVSCFPRRQERWRFGIANFYTSFSSSRRHCFSCMRNFTFKLVDRRANFKVFGNAEG